MKYLLLMISRLRKNQTPGKSLQQIQGRHEGSTRCAESGCSFGEDAHTLVLHGSEVDPPAPRSFIESIIRDRHYCGSLVSRNAQM
jgi:hypothetical protein